MKPLPFRQSRYPLALRLAAFAVSLVTMLSCVALLLAASLSAASPIEAWTSRSLGTNGTFGPAFASGNGTLVVLGYEYDELGQISTPAIATSTDTTNWTFLTPFPSEFDLGHLSRIAFGNNRFVVAGYRNGSGSFLTSFDGLNWTNESSGPSELRDVTYGNGLFVAVGNGIHTSPDGLTWTSRNPATNSYLTTAIYGDGVFVATSACYDALGSEFTGIQTSTDGISWTLSHSEPRTYNIFRQAAYGDGVFVLWEEGRPILRSTNGVDWTAIGSVRDFPRGLAWGNGMFLAAGNLNEECGGSGIPQCLPLIPWVEVSTDGVTWTRRYLPQPVSGGVGYFAGKFFAFGGNLFLQRVAPQVCLSARRPPDGSGFELTISGDIGYGYRLQAATDLSTTNWTDLLPFTLSTLTTNFLDTAATNLPFRFYRVVSP